MVMFYFLCDGCEDFSPICKSADESQRIAESRGWQITVESVTCPDCIETVTVPVRVMYQECGGEGGGHR